MLAFVRLRLALLVCFIVVPVIEIVLFVVVGQAIGLGPTIAIILVTAIIGSWLVARQGRHTWQRLRAQVVAGELPAATLAHGGMILVAGALLLTPGFVTDSVGFALLVPPVRERIRVLVVDRYRNRWTVVP